jgi:hypothetical protein
MQTGIWMAYSRSLHFSDQFSYRKHFYSIYRLKYMNYPRFMHFLEFLQNREKGKTFLTQAVLGRAADGGTGRALTKQKELGWVQKAAGGFEQKGQGSGTAGCLLKIGRGLDAKASRSGSEKFSHRGCAQPQRLTGGAQASQRGASVANLARSISLMKLNM